MIPTVSDLREKIKDLPGETKFCVTLLTDNGNEKPSLAPVPIIGHTHTNKKPPSSFNLIISNRTS